MAFWEDLGDVQVVVFIIPKGWLYDHLSVTSGRSGHSILKGYGKVSLRGNGPSPQHYPGDILPFQATL